MNRGRTLAADTLLSAATNLTLPLSAVVTGPVLARALGVDGRGDLAAIMAPMAFLGFLFTLGVPESMVFHTASARLPLRRLAATAVIMAVLSGIVAAVLVWAFAPSLLERQPHLVGLLRIGALLLPLILVIAALRGVLQGANRFIPINLERMTTVVTRLLVIVVLAVAGALTVASAFLISQATIVLGGLVVLVAAVRIIRGRPGEPRERVLRPVSSYAGAVWLGSLSTLLVLRVDQLLMVPLTSSEQLGLYAVAVAIAEIPTAAVAAVRDVLFARASRDREDTAVEEVARLVGIVAVPASIAFTVVAPFLVPLAFGQDFEGAVVLAQIMWIAVMFSGVGAVYAAGVMAHGRPRALGIAQLGVAALSIVLIIALVPTWGAVGAAFAALVSYAALAATSSWLYSRAAGRRWLDVVLLKRGDLVLLRRVIVRTRRRRPSS